MRVGLVIGQLHAGGSERQLFELARHLKGGACEPYVYCLSEVTDPFGPRLAQEGIPLRTIPRRHGLELRRAVHLSRMLRDDRIDVVNSFSQHANLYAYLSILLARRGVFIASNRVTDLPETVSHRWINGFVYRRSRWVVVNSQEGADHVAMIYHVPPGRIRTLVNGIDASRFQAPADPAGVRSSLGVPEGAPLAGLVGRISAQKRVDVFLEAAREALSRIPQARFLVIGTGELSDEMKSTAARLNLDSKVVFTGATEKVDSLMAALDLLVLTSDFEGFPNVIMEAMAAGRPVVATDVGACRELVSDGVTGFLVPPGDSKAISDKLVQVLTLPDRGRSLGAAGRARVLKEFDVKVMARRFEALYLQAASGAAGPLDGASTLS